jgi:hypothetical protein
MKNIFKKNGIYFDQIGWNPTIKTLTIQHRYSKQLQIKCDPKIVDLIIENSFNMDMTNQTTTFMMNHDRKILEHFVDCPIQINQNGHITLWIASRIRLIVV